MISMLLFGKRPKQFRPPDKKRTIRHSRRVAMVAVMMAVMAVVESTRKAVMIAVMAVVESARKAVMMVVVGGRRMALVIIAMMEERRRGRLKPLRSAEYQPMDSHQKFGNLCPRTGNTTR
jgi:hypothetical protein